MDTQTIFTAIVTLLGGLLGGGALINWLKERKKDDAAALLTNVEALQKQLVLLQQVTDYLRKENTQLAIDRDNEQERSRKLRQRLSEVEAELEEVRRTANQAQQQVMALTDKVRRLVAGDDNEYRHP